MVFGPLHLALLYIGRTEALALYIGWTEASVLYIGEVEVYILKIFFFLIARPERQNYFGLYSLPYIYAAGGSHVSLSFTRFAFCGMI